MTTGWQERFRVPHLSGLELADGNPARGLVVTSLDGGPEQLFGWQVPADGPGGPDGLTALTAEPYGVPDGWLEPSGRFAFYLHDEGGSELGHVVRVPAGGQPAGGQPPRDMTPDLAPYTLRGLGFSGDGGLLCLNPVNADGFALYAVDGPAAEQPGPPRLLYRDTWETWGALASAGGELVACWSTARAGGVRHHTLLALDAGTGEVVGELADDGASVVGVRFSPLPADARLLATTTRTGFVRPVIWDPRTGARRDVELPGVAGEVRPLDWSADGRRLLLCQPAGRQRLHVYDLDGDRLLPLDHPPGTYYRRIGRSARFGPDGAVVTILGTAVAPAEVVQLDAGTGRPRRTLLRVGDAPPGRRWESVTVTSADGTPVHAWYAQPAGPGPYPTVLEVHGGPFLAVVEHYDPAAQCWLDHGYAWMSVNYRGSAMFGREFGERIWGRIGRFELADIAAARDWLVDGGIARADQVFLTGASYGGYLTLYALGRRPDLWAGGIAEVAPADLVASYRQASSALQAAMRGWMRGTPDERPEAWADSSPITHAAGVAAPLLVFQARQDSRAPAEQMRAYQRRLQELGKDIEVVWYDGGHLSRGPEQGVEFQQRMIDFAERVLAGLSPSSPSGR
jgi:dipeptidyl aminopeptidase/acylaminoacyl peptidase